MAYAPSLDARIASKLSVAFARLRELANKPQSHVPLAARLTYPYSARELVKIVQHLEKYGADGLDSALDNAPEHQNPPRVSISISRSLF